jgi:hypothetical protein
MGRIPLGVNIATASISFRARVVDIGNRRNTKLRCDDGVGTHTDRLADRGQTGPVGMAAPQQLGMTPRYTSASEQAKSNHDNPFDNADQFRIWFNGRRASTKVLYHLMNE